MAQKIILILFALFLGAVVLYGIFEMNRQSVKPELNLRPVVLAGPVICQQY
jgi:hypothetical protein